MYNFVTYCRRIIIYQYFPTFYKTCFLLIRKFCNQEFGRLCLQSIAEDMKHCFGYNKRKPQTSDMLLFQQKQPTSFVFNSTWKLGFDFEVRTSIILYFPDQELCTVTRMMICKSIKTINSKTRNIIQISIDNDQPYHHYTH